MRLTLVIATLLAACPAVAGAQDIATERPSPPATIAEMDWLVGRWEGTGIAGRPAVESWLPAAGSTMVGTFVQTDEAGGIMFSEHMYLVEEGGSLVLKLKHFNADLTGWEDGESMLRFRLMALAPCRAEFSGLTMRCEGDDGLVITVRMRADDGATSELAFRFTRAG